VFQETHPDLVKRCWTVISFYVVWVDISLTTEESFLRVWFAHCLDARFQLFAGRWFECMR
jgi:hypothetical protein